MSDYENYDELTQTQNRTILIVDDDPDIRSSLIDIINSAIKPDMATIQIDEASNGLEGMKKMWTKTYGLLISDFIMPKLDGNNMIETLKRVHKENMPENILIISGDHDKLEELKKFNKSLMSVEKPFTPDEIKNYILSIFY